MGVYFVLTYVNIVYNLLNPSGYLVSLFVAIIYIIVVAINIVISYFSLILVKKSYLLLTPPVVLVSCHLHCHKAGHNFNITTISRQ